MSCDLDFFHRNCNVCEPINQSRPKTLAFDGRHIYFDGELEGEIVRIEDKLIYYKIISDNKYLNGQPATISFKVDPNAKPPKRIEPAK